MSRGGKRQRRGADLINERSSVTTGELALTDADGRAIYATYIKCATKLERHINTSYQINILPVYYYSNIIIIIIIII